MIGRVSVKSISRGFATLSFEKFGRPADVLKLASSAGASSPSHGEISVKVSAAPVFSEDIRAVRGQSFIRSTPGVAGSSSVGAVSSVGHGVSEFSSGDKVLVVSPGVWSDNVTVPATAAVKIPESWAPEDAANLPAALSGYAILNNFTKLSAGDVVVQVGGETAIGAAISAIGKASGVKVITATAADLKNAADFLEKLKAEGEVKLAVSSSAAPAAVKTLQRSLATHGVLVVYNGPIESLDVVEGVTIPVGAQIFKNQSIAGFDFVAWAASDIAGVKNALNGVLRLVEQKKLALKAKVFPQSDFLKAFEAVESTAAPAVLKL